MNNKKLLFLQFLFAGLLLQGCSNPGAGFGGYDKPAMRGNKYYTKDFVLTNSRLVIGRPYAATVNDQPFNFIFYSNGFVVHNATVNNNSTPDGKLDYSKIHGEEVGSYITNGDTVLWSTKAGYMKTHNDYSAIFTGSGLQLITKPSSISIGLLKLQ